MSLEEAVPTLEELRSIKIDELMDLSEQPTCFNYATAMLDPRTLPQQGSGTWKARTLLGFVTSMRLDIDDKQEPLKLGTRFGNLSPDVLTKEQLDVLGAWLPEVSEPELRARIADVLWMTLRPRNQFHGRDAVAAYTDAAERHLRIDGHWNYSVMSFDRALMLPKSFWEAPNVVGRIEAILDGKFGPPKGPQLMKLFLKHGIGDAAKYGPLAEAEARRLEKEAESETYATNLSLRIAREYWYVAAKWRARELGEKAPEAKNARIRAAETHVVEADKAREANQLGVEAQFLSDAITALRRAGADRSRIELLVSRMREAQRTAPRINIGTNIDITESYAAGRRSVEGKGFVEAMRTLATVTSSPTKSALRELAVQHISNSSVYQLFPAVITTSDSRVVSHMPALSFNEEGTPTDEVVLRWHMWKEAAWIRKDAFGLIAGAREQLENDHNPCLSDLMPLVYISALVPKGHEGLFARGLLAGLHGNFVEAIHILIPQLENGLRSYIEEVLGKPMVKHDDDGTQAVSLFARVLNHPDLAQALGEDILFDLQGLLIMQESTNLRNSLCHGLLRDEDIGINAVYAWWMVLHICMILVPIRR